MPSAKNGVFDRFKAEILEMAGRGVPAIEIAKILKVKHGNELPGEACVYSRTIRKNLAKLPGTYENPTRNEPNEEDSKEFVRRYLKEHPEAGKMEDSVSKGGKEGQCANIQSTNSSSFHALKTELGLHENTFKLPQPLDDSVKTIKLPVGCDNILFIGDLQIPYHDISAVTCALKYGQESKVNTIYLNGDICDFYSISNYEKDKKLRNMQYELETTREFLSILRNAFPDAHIYYKDGNHEERWARYIREHAGELDGIEELEFANMFHLPKYNIHHISKRTIVEIGKLTAIHGHEIRGVGGVFPARTLWMKTLTSAICGDCHRSSEYPAKTIDDKFYTCWTVGCLSVLRPYYAPGAQYNHGMAHIQTQSNGDFHVRNFRILDGRII